MQPGFFKSIENRMPILPSGFHTYLAASIDNMPIHHFLQTFWKCSKAGSYIADLIPVLVIDMDCCEYHLLVYINATAYRMNILVFIADF